jgi:pimeloyl-ACP methyl ester carboxylesterase
MSKLFVEYVGQGDSDKPKTDQYGTKQRADLIEAHWSHWGVTETSLVSADYSSLVVMELLVRRLEHLARGSAHGQVGGDRTVAKRAFRRIKHAG